MRALQYLIVMRQELSTFKTIFAPILTYGH